MKEAFPLSHQIYEVQNKDTWKSIAQHFYGNTEMSQKILTANLHLLGPERMLVPGQKIIIPKRR